MIALTRIWEGVRTGNVTRETWYVNPAHVAYVRHSGSGPGGSMVVIGNTDHMFEESPTQIRRLIETETS